MSLPVWLTLAAAGLAVGFVSGLVGIGGGVLTVPLLYFVYGHPGWSGTAVAPELQAVVAHATSLLVIVPTALVGTWTYQRRRAVAWSAALPIAVVSIGAALAASRVAPLLPQEALKLAFAAVLLVSGVRLLRRSPTAPDGAGAPGGDGPPRPLLAALGGVGVGVLSALLGVGGGIVAIPVLVYLMRLDLPRVAATSMAVILFTAAAGVVGYATADVGSAALPSATLGYVDWGAALPILVGSVAAVGAGAVVNEKLGTNALRIVFGLVFLVVGGELAVRSAAALLRLP